MRRSPPEERDGAPREAPAGDGSAGAAASVAAVPGRRPRPARGGGPTVSPRARRVAAELRVDWTVLTGSGRTGRIVERDVRSASGDRASPVRRLVAERMSASARATAPVTLTTDADATELVRVRAAPPSRGARRGTPPPSYTDCLVKLVAVAPWSTPP